MLVWFSLCQVQHYTESKAYQLEVARRGLRLKSGGVVLSDHSIGVGTGGHWGHVPPPPPPTESLWSLVNHSPPEKI